MALQQTDLLVVHRPGVGAGQLFQVRVKDFHVNNELATETEEGIVRFATAEEIIEGTNNQLAVSPAKILHDALNSPLYIFDGNSGGGDGEVDYDETPVTAVANPFVDNSATEDQAGIVRLATAEETLAGTDNNIAVTPYGLRQMFNNPAYIADAGTKLLSEGQYDYPDA